MSMIDCKIDIDKKADPKGDRVILTFEYVLITTVLHMSNLLIDLQRKVFAIRQVVGNRSLLYLVLVYQENYTLHIHRHHCP